MMILLLGRVALRAQRSIVIKLSRGQSVGPYVRPYVRQSVQCIVKKGGSDPDVVWHHRSDGSVDETDSGVWGSVNGKEYFWGRIWGAPLYPMGNVWHRCATCLNRRSCGLGWCVRGLRHCCITGGVYVVQGKEEVLGFLFPIFTMANAIGSPTVNCF